MRTVGLKTLKNKLSDSGPAAASGETVRSPIAAGLLRRSCRIIGKPSLSLSNRKDAREGWLTPAKRPFAPLPPRQPVPGYTLELLMADLDRDPEVAVIYVYSSVLLASICWPNIASPPADAWESRSRLKPAAGLRGLARIHANGLTRHMAIRAQARCWSRMNSDGNEPGPLARALEPWPVSLRTLDALQLATMDFLRRNDGSIELASYDNRLIAAAQALGSPPRSLCRCDRRGGRPR